MTIAEIKKMPMIYEDAKTGPSHESVLRSYHILSKVKDMVIRKDSSETIIEMIEYLQKINE